MAQARISAAIAMAGVLLAGCGGGASGLTAALQAAGSKDYPGTPIANYARVGRFMLRCWFGPDGRLTRSHVYRADARPEAEGGDARIVLYEKGQSKRKLGLKAFEVKLLPASGGTALVIANYRLKAPDATRLEADVRRWAAGTGGCAPPPTRWGAVDVRSR